MFSTTFNLVHLIFKRNLVLTHNFFVFWKQKLNILQLYKNICLLLKAEDRDEAYVDTVDDGINMGDDEYTYSYLQYIQYRYLVLTFISL